jgi:large subunit ribosomal protein L9
MPAKTRKELGVIFFEPADKYQAGQVVELSAGHARHYIRTAIARQATRENIALFEKQRAHLEADSAEKQIAATVLKAQIDGYRFIIEARSGNGEKLHNSITRQDVLSTIRKAGVEVSGSQILDHSLPIRSFGEHTIDFRLHPLVKASAILNVVQEGGEREHGFEREIAESFTARTYFEREEDYGRADPFGDDSHSSDRFTSSARNSDEFSSLPNFPDVLIVAPARYLGHKAVGAELEDTVTKAHIAEAVTEYLSSLAVQGKLSQHYVIRPYDVMKPDNIHVTGSYKAVIEMPDLTIRSFDLKVFSSLAEADQEIGMMRPASDWEATKRAALKLG